MNKIIILAISALMLSSCGDKGGKSTTKLKSEIDSVSYAYGQYMAMQIKRSEWDKLNPEMIKMAFRDFNEKGDSGMVFDMMAASQLLMNYDSKAQSKGNLKEGEEFFAKNKKEEGVVELPSGLQYKVITEGTGAMPSSNDTAVCNYTGRLLSGKVFDASQEGMPAKFVVSEVIPGWTEALQMMKIGSKWMLYVPSNLAYGDGNEVIPPGSSLIFEVELVDIAK